MYLLNDWLTNLKKITATASERMDYVINDSTVTHLYWLTE